MLRAMTHETRRRAPGKGAAAVEARA
jgi:hypothetical protein